MADSGANGTANQAPKDAANQAPKGKSRRRNRRGKARGDAPSSPCGCKACAVCETGHSPQVLIEPMIARMGFALIYVLHDSLPFAYSVGMKETHDCPEFIVVGNFSSDVFEAVAGCVAELAAKSKELLRVADTSIVGALECVDKRGAVVKFPIGWKPVRWEQVGTGTARPMAVATQRYGPRGFEVRQVFVPDTEGFLPWDATCDKEWVARTDQISLG